MEPHRRQRMSASIGWLSGDGPRSRQAGCRGGLISGAGASQLGWVHRSMRLHGRPARPWWGVPFLGLVAANMTHGHSGRLGEEPRRRPRQPIASRAPLRLHSHFGLAAILDRVRCAAGPDLVLRAWQRKTTTRQPRAPTSGIVRRRPMSPGPVSSRAMHRRGASSGRPILSRSPAVSPCPAPARPLTRQAPAKALQRGR